MMAERKTKGCCILIAATASLALGAADYVYDEDFSSCDERGLSPAIEIERHTALSHCHGEVEDGNGYVILVPGSKHVLATPPLGDFEIKAKLELRRHSMEFGVGFDVFFAGGHRLRVYFAQDGKLGFFLDGNKFADGAMRIADSDVSSVYPTDFKFSLAGHRLSVSAYGVSATATLAAPKCDRISFDMPYSGGNQLVFRHVRLVSQDAPEKREIGNYTFRLARSQGFSKAMVVTAKLSRYQTGETEVDVLLGGLRGSVTNWLETGGTEWEPIIDRITNPYLRVERRDGSEFANMNLWRGTRSYADPEVRRRARKRNRFSGDLSAKPEEWPVRRTFLFRQFPDDYTLAAGYERAVEDPNRLAENGPWEQIRDREGLFLYEGESIRRGRVAVRILPLPDVNFLARFPKDLPRYEEAIHHASTQGYFLESTIPDFKVEVKANPLDFSPEEVSWKIRLTTVYGDPVESGVKLPVGVYHCFVDWQAGVMKGTKRFVFEVLSDNPEGPCPPLVSGLPELYSMPNETKFLEEVMFDPWAEFGGIQHYYAMSTHYPAVGLTNRVWEALKPYRRKWFVQNERRNTDDSSVWSEQNRFLNKVADYTYSLDDAAQFGDRYDLYNPAAYRAKQLQLLREYVDSRHPPFRLLTAKRLDELARENKGMTTEEMAEILRTCWADFRDFARPKAWALDREFEDELARWNPRIARAGYGPMSFYTCNYKTPWWLYQASKGLETNPVLKRNGSFWTFEDYHHSCDYPLCRAAFFVGSYSMLFPESRRLFPEIYYSGWSRCADGAVFQAHPGKFSFVAPSHQRRLVYDYVYGTPYFRNGRFGYWKDYGFHARNPETETMDEFVKAWGHAVNNPPVRPMKSAFVLVDLGAIRRHGDYLETECGFLVDDGPRVYGGSPDVCNTAEESLAYMAERIALSGRCAPVASDFAELDRITPENCEFVVLPPIVGGTSSETLAAIRRLAERGVPLFASEEVAGLEDIFGVKPVSPRKVSSLGSETFAHKLALAKYESAGARELYANCEGVPLLFAHAHGKVRTAFFNAPPTTLNRANWRGRWCHGQGNSSEVLPKVMEQAFEFLASKPSVFSTRGEVCAAHTSAGDVVVTIGDASPIYHDGDRYPVSFRFTVRDPGIGAAKVDSEAPYEVLSRTMDEVVISTKIDKDNALFFRFVKQPTAADVLSLDLPERGARTVIRIDPGATNRYAMTFHVPISDIQQIWTPDLSKPYLERKWWISRASAPQSSMPCISYFNLAEQNVLFFGAAALEWDGLVESKVNQENGTYDVTFTVAAGEGNVLKPFDVTLDRRALPWTRIVGEWRDSLPYGRGSYPDGAWKPVFCSWYAAHAAVSAKWAERQAAFAADLGFGTFILDDGWSYDEAKRVNPETIKTWYRDVGQWDAFASGKFPDFKSHRERIRKLGLKYVVWVAPYFLGSRSAAFHQWGYDRRKDVSVVEGNALVDIANRPMMESVTAQLIRLLKGSDLDGLKIDFLDSIPPSVKKPQGSLSLDYITRLLRSLREIKPDGLFEFRQNYATPVMAPLATQFRAGDVPFEWQDNLLRIAQIRLTMGDGVPIHADPIYWSDAETDENVARHFMAAMAGVPMLSMDLEKMTAARRETVRTWLRLYKDGIERFHKSGRWQSFYRNGGLVGLVCTLEDEAFVIVNDPLGCATLLQAAGPRKLIVFNLGYSSVVLSNGAVVKPAGAYWGD